MTTSLPPSLQDFVLPAGALFEGELDPKGPIAPGVGEVPIVPQWNSEAEVEDIAEDLQKTAEALKPQLEREVAAKERAKRKAKQQEAENERRCQTASYRVMISDLLDSLSHAESLIDGNSPAKSAVECALSKIEKSGANETFSLVYKFSKTLEEFANEGIDLELLTMDIAKKTGHFGAYRWALRAWIDGGLEKNTTLRVNVSQPPDYQPKAPELPKADPMDEISKTLGLVKTMRDAFGGQNSGGDALKAMEARLEAAEKHRRELRDLEERFEEKAKTRENEAYKHGYEKGQADAKAELQQEIWNLKHQLEIQKLTDGKVDMVDKVISIVGGPDTVKSIVNRMMTSPKAPAPPRRTPPPPPAPIPPPVQVQPPPQAIQTAPDAAPKPELYEPTPNEIIDALEMLQTAKEYATSPEHRLLREEIENYLLLGNQVRGVGVTQFWAFLHTPSLYSATGEEKSMWTLCQELISENEVEMDIPGLKQLLVDRLSEGATSDAILEEVHSLVSPETQNEWRSMMGWMPMSGLLGFLGIPPDLHGPAADVLEKFQKATMH